MAEIKKLYRNTSNKMVAGVCSGLADYLNLDPTIVRLAWLFAVCCAGVGLLAYAAAWIIVPEKY